MSTTLLQCVAECFQGRLEGMHCLGAVTGGDSANPSGVSSRSCVVSVVRALGVLVCEGRIQGPPRGYKEGPHCAAPLQSPPNDHTCEKDNYLCGRYLVLVREIAERITIGSTFCVEVLLCSDCPCGLARSTCKDPLLPSTAIAPWQSDMLLEYWCISVVPSKSPEMMNSQGLYQAVRSRLHFSQVAAWWSRSNGKKPNYVTTRIVPYNDDNLRKFREAPTEHTFPLAGIGDGNSIKVTVWALPRMEEVPSLNCPAHPISEKTEENVARALTPTKNFPIPTPAPTPDALVLPVLVDDRLQTPCNKPGKHHCNCEDEDGCPPSPSIRPHGERKRRRSLPCGPSEAATTSLFTPAPLPSVQETIATNSHAAQNPSINNVITLRQTDQLEQSTKTNIYENRTYLSTGSLERSFLTQVSLDVEGNDEKRYKPTPINSESIQNSPASSTTILPPLNKNSLNPSEIVQSFVPSDPQWPFVDEASRRAASRRFANATYRTQNRSVSRLTNVVVNPFHDSSSFHEPNPGPSSLQISPPCTVHRSGRLPTTSTTEKIVNDGIPKNYFSPGKDLTNLMAKLSFPKEKSSQKSREDGGILEWFTKVPGRVIAVPTKSQPEPKQQSEVKFKNGNLELSQREFNEVLAVLRARTPTYAQGRRRTPVKTCRRRDRSERSVEDPSTKTTPYSLDSYVCPIHREVQRNATEICVCNACKKLNNPRDWPGVARNVSNQTTNKSPEDNVSNKADVLLGAILRTRERRGSEKNENSEESEVASEDIKDPRTTRSDDDKSLPGVINKRLHRFKQLFKKEWDKRETTETSECMGNSVSGEDILRKEEERKLNGRIQRKIDVAKFYPAVVKYEELREGEGKDQNLYSTNYNSKDSYHRKACDRENEAHVESRDGGEKDGAKKNGNGIGIGMINEALAGRSRKGCEIGRGDSEEDEAVEKGVPSAIEQERFRRSLENAASMVFHSRTGLPLTSSPAPLRRGSCCFDYDSSLNSVSSKRSALFELNTPPSPGSVSLEEADREIENCVEDEQRPKRPLTSRSRPQSHALLGSFEESVLNGRLEPVSTVQGFTADLGASGSFCPKHRKLPVTVFFYTLGDNDKVSTPYLAHINLGKKGYQVPRRGTIQVTLLNPHGTVVKMFVIMYDLSDMPPRSHTFLRQRTLRDKMLRYLVHLRFVSGKSGRIYLHTDIRMIICRKSDADTASDFVSESPKELSSFLHGPTNPKFSPRC